MVGLEARRESGSSIRRVLWAAAIASLLGGAFACAQFTAGGTTAQTGDEPPIRVKNGSLDIEITRPTAEWAHDGSPKWKVNGPKRKNDALVLDISLAPGVTCTDPLRTGQVLEVRYLDQTATRIKEEQVIIRSRGQHTRVEPEDKPLKKQSALLLQDGVTGYISALILDNTPICSFQNKDELMYVEIHD